MKKLKDEYRAICKEYARQTGKIIGCDPEFFLRNRQSINTCMFGDNYFLTMEEMQQIVDHMDMWMHHYGNAEKIVDAIISYLEYQASEGEHGRECYINLWQWMTETVKPGSNQEELLRLNAQLRVLEDVAKHYPTSSIGNIIMQMSARVKVINEMIKEGKK